jgi:hypothetical protein
MFDTNLFMKGLARKKEKDYCFLPNFRGIKPSSFSRLSIVPTNGITLQTQNIRKFLKTHSLIIARILKY